MPKKKKKRVKSEPKPAKWLIFKCFNQTKEEVYFGASQTRPKWQGNKNELRRVPELAHWDIEEDKIMIVKIFKRKRFVSEEQALIEARYWERTYDHWRNFWVIQTGPNTLRPPRVRKIVKPPRLPYGYRFDPDLVEEDYVEGDVNEGEDDVNEEENDVEATENEAQNDTIEDTEEPVI